MDRGLRAILLGLLLTGSSIALADEAEQVNQAERAEQFFESKVRPLLVARCYKCHSGEIAKGGLRLDSRDGLLQGGDSGAVVVVGKPEESVLVEAVRYQNGLAMPPTGKLDETQIVVLSDWIKTGAVWPGPAAVAAAPPPTSNSIVSVAPNAGELAPSLQLWLKADALASADGEPVYVWPDQSGHGRDVAPTKGVRPGGVGMPPRFVRESDLLRRPAVRFDTAAGLASSPDNRLPIDGDAAATIMLVVNLRQHDVQPACNTIVAFGNLGPPADAGRALGLGLQIKPAEGHALALVGGFNHDASLGSGAFNRYYGKPILLTVTKQPGPMRSTTRIFINGEHVLGAHGEPLGGTDDVPAVQHRPDVGIVLGRAVDWTGSIQGDVGEVLVYDRALVDRERLDVECYLADKFGLMLQPLLDIAPRAQFTPEEQAYWAYQPVRANVPPAVRDESWVRMPSDRFVLARLESLGLAPAPPGGKQTLLRRVTFDLTGLPPTPEEVAAFLADDGPQAYESVVNRLLESPHYGEQWARHWLDLVRYAETTGNDANAVMSLAWRYRNYVVDAFNRDLPYDQFLIEQLAGDLLPPTDSLEVNTRRVIATGFLMVGSKALAETDKEQSRLDIVDDQIDVTGRALLGLTLGCARCHDHKFDAIRTSDYYALAGIFRSTEPFQNEERNASMWWEYPLPQGAGKEPLRVMAPKDSYPRNLRIHLRGNHFTLGAVAPRGTLAIIEQVAFHAADAAGCRLDPGQLTSGRLELARWIAEPANPLTARVMVNRIWQHHFGRGIVATSDNFGARGEQPTHPELLDWLAAQFVESGWSVKALHRLIVLSAAYRQSGQSTPAADEADPDRRWLSSFARRRLSAEELRDAILAASGQLDLGPGSSESGEYLLSKADDIKAQIRPNRVTADDPYYSTFTKRSIYLPIVRNLPPDVLGLFDGADANGVVAQRSTTTVAPQSLFLLNSPFVREQARALAERLLADDSLSDAQRVQRAHDLVLGRAPSAGEQAQAGEFLSAYLSAAATQDRPPEARRLAAWQSYCQSLFCANEFAYVE